jgi:hypothetical protein
MKTQKDQAIYAIKLLLLARPVLRRANAILDDVCGRAQNHPSEERADGSLDEEMWRELYAIQRSFQIALTHMDQTTASKPTTAAAAGARLLLNIANLTSSRWDQWVTHDAAPETADLIIDFLETTFQTVAVGASKTKKAGLR